MQLRKTFTRTRFDSGVISRALEDLSGLFDEYDKQARAEHEARVAEHKFPAPYSGHYGSESYSVEHGNESWYFDTVTEWYASYDRGADSAMLTVAHGPYQLGVQLHGSYAGHSTSVSVSAPTNEKVERLMRYFNQAEASCKEPEPPVVEKPATPVVVFIGHGRSADWRDIKDHLRDSHHYTIEAYEVGARAGHSIRDVLDTMLQASSFALLVMTAEDETAGGDPRARQNVVHEAGLFQGRLGFNRAIAVVENGVEVFSNLDGVQQIRYDKGNVRSTFGEILATLRREFGDRR